MMPTEQAQRLSELPEIRTDIPTPKNSLYSRYIKRFLDILLSGLAILVLSPVLLIIAVLELIFHGRPIMYVDKRPGKDGKLFKMYKFRSMSNARDEDGKLLHASLRITRFGRILRRTSLDELAGLFNVFNGTMSIIGPRPLMADYLPLYNERHRYRHAVRPGLACWNLSGGEALTSASWTWNTQFESDIYYVENVSFWLDIKMVLKTIKIVFTKSEMRTNAGRVRFNGENLNETRSRDQILADAQREEAAVEVTAAAEEKAVAETAAGDNAVRDTAVGDTAVGATAVAETAAVEETAAVSH